MAHEIIYIAMQVTNVVILISMKRFVLFSLDLRT